MNWLAHLFLSEPNPGFRIGNLLPDIAPPPALKSLPADFLRGIIQHKRIDAFTDSHPIVRQSISRIKPPLRRYAPIIVDLFYDHFLSCNWAVYSSYDLQSFVSEFYASIDDFSAILAGPIHERLVRIREGNWISTYHSIEGIAAALNRTSKRLSRPVDLASAAHTLEKHHGAFETDFQLFFPQLVAHVMPTNPTP